MFSRPLLFTNKFPSLKSQVNQEHPCQEGAHKGVLVQKAGQDHPLIGKDLGQQDYPASKTGGNQNYGPEAEPRGPQNQACLKA